MESGPPRSVLRLLAGALGGLALLGAAAGGGTALAANVASAPYSDISGNANQAAITFLTAENVLNGYPDGTFKPAGLITRAEFTAAAVRLLGSRASATADALAQIKPSFKDAKQIPTWAWGYVNYAQSNKIIEGFPNGYFEPNANVTMVQAAAILIRLIGDAGIVTGTWPANYTIAAYNYNLTSGVTFAANLPATRGEVAQLAYNAVIDAPTLQSGYTSGTPSGAPMYLGGNGMAQVSWTGTVSASTTSTISIQNAQGQSVLSAPLAASYYLVGASDITTLQGAEVVVAENAQGQIDFVQVLQTVQTESSTLADSSVATPAGYNRVAPWWVSEGGVNSLLLSNGTLVPMAGATSGSGTNFYLNAPSAGAAVDPHSLVAGASSLGSGEAVTYVLNQAGQATTVYAKGPTLTLGVVSSVNTSTGAVVVTTGSTDGTLSTVSTQSWTTVEVNGAASTVSALQPNDVVDVYLVGGGNAGDTNASDIVATRTTATGTVTSVTTNSGAGGAITTLGLTQSNGQTQTVAEDSSFDAHGLQIQVGSAVTLVLDAQGQARAALSATAPQAVVLVEQLLTTQTTTGTFNQIQADNGGHPTVYTLANGVTAPQPGSTGYLAVLSFQAGTNTVTGISQLTQFTPPSGDTLQVVSSSSTSVLVQEMSSTGQVTGTAFYLTTNGQGPGAVAYALNSETYIPLSQLQPGQQVQLYETSSGQMVGIRE